MSTEQWRPNRWWAALLTLFLNPLGLLYVQCGTLAIIYFCAAACGSLLFFAYPALRWRVGDNLVPVLALVVVLIGVVHTFVLATRYRPNVERKWYSRWYGLLAILFCAVTLAYTTRAFFIEPMRTRSGLMYPSVPEDSFVLVSKWGSGVYSAYGMPSIRTTRSAPIDRGDLVLFYRQESPAPSVIRVIGLPGEHIEYKSRRLKIDGRDIPLAFDGLDGIYQLAHETLDKKNVAVAFMPERFSPDLDIVVPKDHYVLLGDNRDNARDSRYVGAVPRERIGGKIVKIFAP
jgi:signal peptidase I